MNSWSSNIVAAIFILGLVLLTAGRVSECRPTESARKAEVRFPAINCRKHSASITDFGGKGDGKTSNTNAFRAAIASLEKLANQGGAQLVIPPGKWLTGSFGLISHFTLYLHKNAVILASMDEQDFPILAPLPSYGRGRDTTAGRFSSLITGTNLTDVVITGQNGTIDGQGAVWWKKFKDGVLNSTRPYLFELMFSDKLQISNVTFLNSPSWNIHPVYSSNILIQGVTVLAPIESPNTDGINPDSCTNVKIEDSYVISGDDCIALKSGWDQYGIKFGRPTQHVIIRRFTCISPFSALIALGSEMSGGLSDIRAEDIYALNTESGVRIKSAPGRGGFVKDVFVRGMHLKTIKYVFWMSGAYGQHADDGWDPKAFPQVTNINYDDVSAENVTMTANLGGIEGHPFTGICISNVKSELAPKPKKLQWNCTDVQGVSTKVTPSPCAELAPAKAPCPYPKHRLHIDSIKLKTCSI